MPEEQDPLPDEAEIEALLSSFRPGPSANFYHKMAAAPWQPSSARSPRPIQHRWTARRWLMVVCLLVVASSALLVSPTLRALARQVMFYFSPAAADMRAVMITIAASDQAGAFLSTAYFNLDWEAASAAAGFPLKTLPAEAENWLFAGAHYNPTLQAVTLRYLKDSQSLLLTQRLSSGVEEYASIGASAPVETVFVNDDPGEYVAGGWVITSEDQLDGLSAPPGTQVILGARWDAQLPQQILRWQRDGMLFEILLSGSSPDKEGLIHLAEIIE
jgi:hypothetical protein